MSVKNTFAGLMLGAALTSPAFSQEENPVYKNEASVQAFGSFVKSTTSNGIEQNATNSGGVLASYRYFFNKHHGVELNYGYALNFDSRGSTGPRSCWPAWAPWCSTRRISPAPAHKRARRSSTAAARISAFRSTSS